MKKLKTIQILSKQGLFPLIGHIVNKLFRINLGRYYDARDKNKIELLGLDPNTIDFQSFDDFLSQITPRKTLSSVDDFLVDNVIQEWVSDIDSEQLGNLLRDYGSDKSTRHNYYLAYQPIINQVINKIGKINLTEIGLGTNNLDVLSNMGVSGSPGASARAFRDYSQQINVYGADIDKRILFEEDRIKTFYVDQLKQETIERLIQLSQPDILIDDGLHAFRPNLNVLNKFIHYAHRKENKWLIIEDIYHDPHINCWSSILPLLEERFGFTTWILNTKPENSGSSVNISAHLVIIKT